MCACYLPPLVSFLSFLAAAAAAAVAKPGAEFPAKKGGKELLRRHSLASLRKKAKTHHADTLLPGRNTFDSGEGERKSIILPFLFFHTRPREKSSSHSVDIVFLLLLFSLISHEHFSSSPLSSLSSSSYWHCCKTRLVGKGTPTPPPPLSPLWHHENHCLLAWLCS